jgi:NDP-sugar pyrophosphorylase family protein
LSAPPAGGPAIRQAVVLAGGMGTRLGPLTAHTPKPLLPVAGTPFLDWVLGGLETHGVSDVILAVGYRADAFDAWIGRAKTRASLRIFREEEPLGTGGALPRMADWLDDAFFVLNGDTLFDAPLEALGALLRSSGALGAVALREVTDTARYGSVHLEDDRVTGFSEKGGSGAGLINGGVYAFRRAVVERIGSPSSLETELLPGLAESGELVGLPAEGFFLDIGLPGTYEEAQTAVPEWWWGRSG